MIRKLVHKKTGCVKITRKNRERLAFSIDGREIGFVEFDGIPDGKRIRVACFFDAEVRIMRPEKTDGPKA